MPPRRNNRTIAFALAAALVVIGMFFAGGAVLAWRVETVAAPAWPVARLAQAAAAVADLGWRFWMR